MAIFLGALGCKTDGNPTGMPHDMSKMGDGSGGSCESTKCENPDSKCCSGEPCIDVKTNPVHCGECGKTCRTREVCSNGLCACRAGGRDAVCPTDALCCSDGCHDVKSDTMNCGGCGVVCKTGESCIDSQCKCGPAGLACKSGQICCGTGCSDLQNDPQNCGMCGKVCPMGKGCKNGLCDGECATPCTFPYACCDGMCANLSNDPKNCRACGRDCNKVTGIGICIAFICVGEKPDGGTDMSPPADL